MVYGMYIWRFHRGTSESPILIEFPLQTVHFGGIPFDGNLHVSTRYVEVIYSIDMSSEEVPPPKVNDSLSGSVSFSQDLPENSFQLGTSLVVGFVLFPHS